MNERKSYGLSMSLAVLCALTYLTFEAVQGENGILRLLEIEGQEQELRRELDQLIVERRVVENRVELLSGDRIDLDLLDERARLVLTFGRADEIAIP